MGEVVEVGSGVQSLKKGDRVVVPFALLEAIRAFLAAGLGAQETRHGT